MEVFDYANNLPAPNVQFDRATARPIESNLPPDRASATLSAFPLEAFAEDFDSRKARFLVIPGLMLARTIQEI